MRSDDTFSFEKIDLGEIASRISSLRMNKCVVLINQIRTLLASVGAEPFPRGFSRPEIEERIKMFQSLLEILEEHATRLRISQKLKEQQHLLRVQEQRLEKAEARRRKNSQKQRQRNEQERLLQESRSLYYANQKEDFHQKVSQCKVYKENVVASLIAKGEEREASRASRINKLQREHSIKQLVFRNKQVEKAERAKSVKSRRLSETALDHLRRQQESDIRAAEVEVKLELIRKSRISAITSRAQGRCAPRTSMDKAESVPARLSQKKYQEILEEMETKHRQQKERYAEHRAALLEYEQMRACSVANRRLRQKVNALRLLDKKLARDEKLMASLRERVLKSAKLKEAYLLRFKESGKNTLAAIEMHKHHADQIKYNQQIDAMRAKLQRWNYRAAGIMKKVSESVLSECA